MKKEKIREKNRDGLTGSGWGRGVECLEGLSEIGLRMTVVRSDAKWTDLLLNDFCCFPMLFFNNKMGRTDFHHTKIKETKCLTNNAKGDSVYILFLLYSHDNGIPNFSFLCGFSNRCT